MKNRTFSTKLSLAVCVFFAAVLAVSVFTFPQFLQWFYVSYHHLNAGTQPVTRNLNAITATFYVCAPFAAAALYMLIRLLMNILKNDVFITKNVLYLRLLSWCCFSVALATGIGAFFYMPLGIITAAMAVVGTLLRVVKNLIHAAVALREENDLTI